MRIIANTALDVAYGMYDKARIILIFSGLTIVSLLWVDAYTRGLLG